MAASGQRAVVCYVGIGANLGEPAANCLEAMDRLARQNDMRLVKRSSLFRSQPVGVLDQPEFVNAAVELKTALSPRALLSVLQEIEIAMGRIRGKRHGPRVIDLDVLLYGQEMIREEGLTVPHPELHKRRFVLAPMYEIAPFVVHPTFGVSIRGLLDRLEDENLVEVF